jgi:hypothetical protein
MFAKKSRVRPTRAGRPGKPTSRVSILAARKAKNSRAKKEKKWGTITLALGKGAVERAAGLPEPLLTKSHGKKSDPGTARGRGGSPGAAGYLPQQPPREKKYTNTTAATIMISQFIAQVPCPLGSGSLFILKHFPRSASMGSAVWLYYSEQKIV